jgi:hypothetical protein
MTGEAIEKAIATFVDSQEFLDFLGDSYDNRCTSDDDIRRVLASSMRALVSQAYEEAARAECRYCRYGLPVEAVSGSATNDLIPLGETYYLHRADGAYIHGDMRCESHNIRALKDSLVQEPVSSSV